MNVFEADLTALQNQIIRKRKLKSMLESLRSEKDLLTAEAAELAKSRDKEERDVEALERVSLSSILSAIRGDKDERLHRERLEARTAALKHESALRQLEKTEADIRKVLEELNGMADAEKRYEAAVKARIGELKLSGNAAGREACELEERQGYLRGQTREIGEASAAGNSALSQLELIENSLESAEGWGIFDMIGGGMLSAMAKHSHLDEAQSEVEHLQYLLDRFRTELSDIRIESDLRIQIDGFMRFADYFFDGLIADWVVLDRIHDSQRQVSETKAQILKVLDDLRRMGGAVERELESIKNKLDNIALKSTD